MIILILFTAWSPCWNIQKPSQRQPESLLRQLAKLTRELTVVSCDLCLLCLVFVVGEEKMHFLRSSINLPPHTSRCRKENSWRISKQHKIRVGKGKRRW